MSLSESLNSRIWSRHGVKIAWGIAVALLLVVLIQMFYDEYSHRKQRIADSAPQKLQPITRNSGPVYRVTDITSANLFGDPRPKTVVRENIRDTNLNLKLVGVLWASDQKNARVLIESNSKNAALYSVGDSIKGASASVKEIYQNEILLNRNGATEKLSLAKQKDSSDLISYTDSSSADNNSIPASFSATRNNSTNNSIGRSSNRKPISANGENRKIRKPNFSGLDRALKKMSEL